MSSPLPVVLRTHHPLPPAGVSEDLSSGGQRGAVPLWAEGPRQVSGTGSKGPVLAAGRVGDKSDGEPYPGGTGVPGRSPKGAGAHVLRCPEGPHTLREGWVRGYISR